MNEKFEDTTGVTRGGKSYIAFSMHIYSTLTCRLLAIYFKS